MSNQTASIITKSSCQKNVYKILTFDTHERYQTQLAKTGHDFYAFRYDGCKEWDTQYSKKPENYYTLPANSIYHGLDFDFILAQSKFGQIQTAHKINNILRLPIVSLEHTLPIPSWPNEQFTHMRQLVGNINVFISEYSASRWGFTKDYEVVHHSVDTELFTIGDLPRENRVLSVVNDFQNRDYCCNYTGWCRITKDFKDQIKIIGNSPGLSRPAGSPEELSEEYQKSLVFLNTSTFSPIPTSLLEAMACGCAVVSTATCMIPEIIENGVNGFISNDEEELKDKISYLLANPEEANRLGKHARQTIIEKFSEEKFINNWNQIFNKAYGFKK
jgi:hypothetical protein